MTKRIGISRHTIIFSDQSVNNRLPPADRPSLTHSYPQNLQMHAIEQDVLRRLYAYPGLPMLASSFSTGSFKVASLPLAEVSEPIRSFVASTTTRDATRGVALQPRSWDNAAL